MQEFLVKHQPSILGTLSGFDRLRFQGTLRMLAFALGMSQFLQRTGVLLKDFGKFVEDRSRMLKAHLERQALELPTKRVVYVSSCNWDKEQIARSYLDRSGADPQGRIVWLSCQESCRSFAVRGNAQSKFLELRSETRRCLHYYLYLIHPVFGFMHVRLQSWFPFSIQICLNGREWLSHQMDAAGIAYQRRDNTFTWVQDFDQAQRLLDSQSSVDWVRTLEGLIQVFHPATACQLKLPSYYWSVQQSEWATDIAFRSPTDLARLFPRLLRHGIETFHSRDVLRFLGQKTTPIGEVPPALKQELRTTFKGRPEGVCIRHTLGHNSVKLYDKQRSVLRTETTIHDSYGLKSYRKRDDDPDGPGEWCGLRKGVADLYRRTELSQASNDRCLTAYAAADSSKTLGETLAPYAQRVRYRKRRHRALRLADPEDVRLLEAIVNGDHLIQGFRNRDLAQALYPTTSDSPQHRKQRTHRVSRLLRLLQAHKLIRKIPGTHRYLPQPSACETAALLRAAQHAQIQTLMSAA